MAEMKFQFTGINAVIALIVVVALVGLRLATLGESDDPALREAVKTELMSELGGRTGEALANLDRTNPEAVRKLTQEASLDAIHIHRLSVSKPLLSLSSDEKAIVRVQYNLADDPEEVKYWQFRHSPIGGWRYQYTSTVVGYYLNFL
ncbi:hypothetical protein QQM79_04415 [Marinobacteraceae bacterium S3BR75-40.1]